jgi:erythromycin esterase-like protein
MEVTMVSFTSKTQKDILSAAAHPLRGEPDDYDALMERIGDAQIVLIGEATHGTHGFYYERAEITKRLIAEKGFTTYTGTVAAASKWGGAVEMKRVRPGLAESYEALFHNVDDRRFMLLMDENQEATQILQPLRLERAIGIIYRPETERVSHYFQAKLPQQFDVMIHIDSSRAVEPLDQVQPDTAEPETFPSAL